jgi:hypothetical protein
MKKPKLMIAFIFLVLLSALWAEYNLGIRFGIILSIATASVLLAVVGALLRAPEGYENENGFHIRPRRRQARLRQALAMSASRS